MSVLFVLSDSLVGNSALFFRSQEEEKRDICCWPKAGYWSFRYSVNNKAYHVVDNKHILRRAELSLKKPPASLKVLLVALMTPTPSVVELCACNLLNCQQSIKRTFRSSSITSRIQKINAEVG